MGRASASLISGTNSAFVHPAAAASRSAQTRGPWWSVVIRSVYDSLDGGRVAVFRDIGFHLIADSHLIHLGVVIDADAPGFAIIVPDGHIVGPDVADPALD